jgi:hypothetical protein
MKESTTTRGEEGAKEGRKTVLHCRVDGAPELNGKISIGAAR